MQLFKRITLLTGLTATLFAATAFAQTEENIAERIAPVGNVYLDGEIETANTSEPAESAGPRTGEQVYNSFCVACHGTGALGAPLKGNAEAWASHIAKGEATLIKHAIEGFNSMPARGTCSTCTDEEIEATVHFLIKGL